MIEVKYPDKEKKEKSISFICEQTKRKRKNVLIFLIDAYREIGISVILKNSVFIYLLSIVIYILGLALSLHLFKSAFNNEKVFADVLSLFFFAAPVVTQLSELLYFTCESSSGMLEYRNSYKYTAYQVSLLRMPLFSVAAMGVNCVIAVVWCLRNGISNVLAPIGLIACSVFIYALVNAAFFTRFQHAGFVITAVLWFAINGVLFTLGTKNKIALFVSVPFAMHAAFAAVLVLVFVKVVQKSYLKPVCLITE